ncbi:Cap-specific mRNA (nucleoside-2'-O-)-methyltransferase 1 [Habropoda laboriosa]|uniref:Cap-specific mRNA (nucleoside-2'-O-)-methyltransferase 1 n=2 Tax=Habropoda laboriosa TaxID=597456 RepID=A0A0L7R2K9_9HYME|nr:Cap-specific mRNA (nucleoside-2'-O-)-methyltransferase 1 [Habropoda laboriosa]
MRPIYEDSYHYSKIQNHKAKNEADVNIIDKEKEYDTRGQVSKQEPKNDLGTQNKVQRMMLKMGYKEGHGLGKNKQGRLEPVQAFEQHGRRGLGLHVHEIKTSGHKWDPAEEEIKVVEDIKWTRNLKANLPTSEEMQLWLKKGPKKLIAEDKSYFCDDDIVRDVSSAKTVLEDLDDVEMRRARKHSNPYETIRGAIFLNRAAVKMANIDKACNFMFTNPKNLANNELLYFADVCAGPGGFSEYVLWKKKWHAKGFGLTLKNDKDFKLDDFYAGPCETFHPYYGPKENGDVYDPSNQEAFKDIIMTHTHGKGVHFMMADGGFSVEDQEMLQEILSKQLYLCQCIVALMIVRIRGHFVTKLFDLFTPFSAGLVYLMYRCFEEVCIFKPNSSRPANSERYLICKRKRPGTEDVLQHLKHVNEFLLKDEKNDVLHLVSLEELEGEKQFLQYLRESNNSLGKRQIIALRKLAAFYEDSTLVEVKQAKMRKECLKYWEIPDQSRTMPRHMPPHERLKHLLQNTDFLSSHPTKLTKNNIDRIKNPYDWFCMPCGTGLCNQDQTREEKQNATFYMGMGRSQVYRYVRGTWVLVDDIKVELPPDTLLYAEVVYERTKESKHQRKVFALHILDAVILGSENISQMYLRDRHELAKKFCEALWKPVASNYARIRVKELFPVSLNICERLQVTKRLMKNNHPALVYEFLETPLECNNSDNDKPYFILNSVIFLKSIANSWSRFFSKRHSMTYVYHFPTTEGKFDEHRPRSAEASFFESFENSIIWYWPSDESLTMEYFATFIKKICPTHNRTVEY